MRFTRRVPVATGGRRGRAHGAMAGLFRHPARWASLLAACVPVLAVFPGLSLSRVAWFALVPALVLFTRAPSAREAVARGWWFGAGYLITMLSWMAPQIGPGSCCSVPSAAAYGRRSPCSPARCWPGPARVAAIARGAGRAPGDLADPRMVPLLPGPRRPLGPVRRLPVAAPGGAGPGRRRRNLAGERGPGHRQHGDHRLCREPGENLPSARARGRGAGGAGRRRRVGAARVRADAAIARRTDGDGRAGPAGHRVQRGPAGATPPRP